jgi:hypothetical protein
MKNNKLTYLSITTLITSIIGILFILLKFDIEFSLKEISFGLLGATIGGILSFSLSYIFRKKVLSKVFIAHNYNDTGKANQIKSYLVEHLVEVYSSDESTEIGNSIIENSKNRIKKSNLVIVIVSKDYHKSKSLKKIIDNCKSQHKRILPVIVDDSELPNSLSNYKYVDITNNFDLASKDLLSKIVSVRDQDSYLK